SDGSVVHEWVYAKLRLVAGSYPGTRTPLEDRHRSAVTAALEAAVDDIGLLMRRHAGTAYQAFVHVPVEFGLTPDNRPVNENSRDLARALPPPALRATGAPAHTVHADVAERLARAVKHLGLQDATVITVDEAVERAAAPTR